MSRMQIMLAYLDTQGEEEKINQLKDSANDLFSKSCANVPFS